MKCDAVLRGLVVTKKIEREEQDDAGSVNATTKSKVEVNNSRVNNVKEVPKISCVKVGRLANDRSLAYKSPKRAANFGWNRGIIGRDVDTAVLFSLFAPRLPIGFG